MDEGTEGRGDVRTSGHTDEWTDGGAVRRLSRQADGQTPGESLFLHFTL
jgi:hypothetical protein